MGKERMLQLQFALQETIPGYQQYQLESSCEIFLISSANPGDPPYDET
jgi:hypothetical protein